mmetsp:Transcript_23100/g.71949  ORF Transcript_23100/g.71949 Transcript_23100/m.71949 type:complete len:412 (+) Transcript_23100:465-1700(+)
MLDERPAWQTRGLAPYRRQDVWLVQETAKAVARAPHLGDEARCFVGRTKLMDQPYFLFKVKRPPPVAEDDEDYGADREGSITVVPMQGWQVFRARRSQRELDQSLDEIADKQKANLLKEKTRQSHRKSKLADRLRRRREGEEGDLEDDIQDDIAYRHQGDVFKMLKERKLERRLGTDAADVARHDEDDIALEERDVRDEKRSGYVDDGDYREYGEDGKEFKPVYLGSDDEVENADEEGMADDTIDPDDDPFAYQDEEEEEDDEEEDAGSEDDEEEDYDEEDAPEDGPGGGFKRSASDAGVEETKSGSSAKRARGESDGPQPYAMDPLTGFRVISQESVIDALREYGQSTVGVTREEFLKPFQDEIEAALLEGDTAKAKFIAKKIRSLVKEVTDKHKHPVKGDVYKLKAQYF